MKISDILSYKYFRKELPKPLYNGLCSICVFSDCQKCGFYHAHNELISEIERLRNEK